MKRIGTAVLATVLLAVWAVLPVRSAPAYGPQQTIVLAIDISDAVSLDPQMAYEQSTILTDLQTYNTLVKFPIGDFRQVNPSLATSWTVSQDNKTYTFHLRHGIKFSSGNTMTAQDVVYTFQRVVNLQKDPASWLITQMGLDDKNVTSAVTAPDPYTVVISLPKPFSPGAFFSILANPVASVVDSQTVKAHVQGDDWGDRLAERSLGRYRPIPTRRVGAPGADRDGGQPQLQPGPGSIDQAHRVPEDHGRARSSAHDARPR